MRSSKFQIKFKTQRVSQIITGLMALSMMSAVQAKTTHLEVATFDHHNHSHSHSHEHDKHNEMVGSAEHFWQWLQDHPDQKDAVIHYQTYLATQLGSAKAVPPLHNLLTTARSWRECNAEPYQVPPTELWAKILPTIQLYHELRQVGILPPSTKIRSVYRNHALNQCAGGAKASKHTMNAAIDIWVPTYDANSSEMLQLQDMLCQFWHEQGAKWQLGLGVYATGALHLDTQGYRKWGVNYTQPNSVCRYTPPLTVDY
ncbi:D-Ala-D-Ala carboxypeptidase family metallohydrolase [Moraxella nasovis]|uniref:D-Ala-D-Ala carboxypeptidase family metallohydrolase n=1 Tax=Moraxella nasovis TaxID=2904121 RepID=UPI001F6239B8|nr:D-Ala-D-Ala carboxypeptidase family metallohydrolase [Moraxella nasovis]UNU73601.1 D-Ala-D-Ala carboxypeptidase family metallohydrolase [Moraxella nasovis]